MMSQSSQLGQDLVAVGGELPHGRWCKDIYPGKVDSQCCSRPVESGSLSAREIGLNVEPVSRIVGGVVDGQNHGHRLHQPVAEIALVNPYRQRLTTSHPL